MNQTVFFCIVHARACVIRKNNGLVHETTVTHIYNVHCNCVCVQVCIDVNYYMLFDCIINPRRACAARVGLFVCLSVYAYSRSTGYEAAYERYQQLEGYESMKIKKAIFLKRLRSRDMA